MRSGELTCGRAEGEPGPLYPTEMVMAATMCARLTELGLTPPLGFSSEADVSLAVKAIAALGVGGAFPPPADSAAFQRLFWGKALALATAVRSGEVTCTDAAPAGPEVGPDIGPGLPSSAAVEKAICEVLLPLADPASAFLDAGLFAPDAAAALAGDALRTLGYVGIIPPQGDGGQLWAQAVAHALDVIEGRTSCEVANAFIVIDTPRGPGGYVQVEQQESGDGDAEYSTFAHLVDLYPGMQGASSSDRFRTMRSINDHPLNAGLLRASGSDYIRDNVGPMAISFNPRYRAGPRTILERFQSGNALAVVFLPVGSP